MSFFQRLNFFSRKKKKQRTQEEILQMIGALTILEISNSRTFRRKIEKTEFGRKLKQLVNY